MKGGYLSLVSGGCSKNSMTTILKQVGVSKMEQKNVQLP